MNDVGMSQRATLATRNEGTQRLKPPEVIRFAECAIGTAIRALRGRSANGCERLRKYRACYTKPHSPAPQPSPAPINFPALWVWCGCCHGGSGGGAAAAAAAGGGGRGGAVAGGGMVVVIVASCRC